MSFPRISVAVFALAGFLARTGCAQMLLPLVGQTRICHIPVPSRVSSGLGRMFVGATYTRYGPEDPRGETGHYGLSFTRALTRRLDGAVFVTYGAINTGDEGLSGMGLSLKVSADPVVGGLSAAALITFQVAPTRAPSLVSSGGLNFLSEFSVAYVSGRQRWIGSLGLGRMDDLEEARQSLEPKVTLVAGAGYQLALGSKLGLFVELNASSVLPERDEDLFFQIGGRARVSRGLAVVASWGLGLPDRLVANTDVRAVVGVLYETSAGGDRP